MDSRYFPLCWLVQVYEYYITVDVEGVGEELLSIPLKADCQVNTRRGTALRSTMTAARSSSTSSSSCSSAIAGVFYWRCPLARVKGHATMVFIFLRLGYSKVVRELGESCSSNDNSP